MHINLTYGQAANLPASQSAPQASDGARQAEEGVIDRSHGVSFSGVVQESHEPSAPPPDDGGRGAWGKEGSRGYMA